MYRGLSQDKALLFLIRPSPRGSAKLSGAMNAGLRFIYYSTRPAPVMAKTYDFIVQFKLSVIKKNFFIILYILYIPVYTNHGII